MRKLSGVLTVLLVCLTLVTPALAMPDEPMVADEGGVMAFDVTGPMAPADLSVMKSVETASPVVGAGDTVTYTIEISNTGTFSVTDVVVSDDLPPILTFGVWLEGNDSSVIMQPPSIVWEADSIPAGETYRLRFTATVAPDITPQTMLMDVVNTAVYTSANGGSGSADAVFRMAMYLFMPLVMRNAN